jgi:hypothetical protein
LEVADAVTELCAAEERREDATLVNTADLTADVK